MNSRHLSRIPNLGERLSRLSLPDLFEVALSLGVDPANLAPTGNVAAWSVSGQVLAAIGGQYAKLDAVLQHVEHRNGLDSPNWYPWPLKIDYRIVVRVYGDGPKPYGWCEDLGIIHCPLGSIEAAETELRPLIEEMLLLGHGLDVKAINAGDFLTEGFDCLKLYCSGYDLSCDDAETLRGWMERLLRP